MLNDRTRLAAVMLANNETGVLQPIAELAAISRPARRAAAHRRGTGGGQAAGGLSARSGSLRSRWPRTSFMGRRDRSVGGRQRMCRWRRFCTAAFSSGGCGRAPSRWRWPWACAGRWNYFEARRRHVAAADARTAQPASRRGSRPAFRGHVVNGAGGSRLSQTSNLAFLGLDRQALAMALDLAGIACSTGSACASGSSEPSSVLLAMRCPREVVGSSLRFSLGIETTAAEIDEAVRRILATTTNFAPEARHAIGPGSGGSDQHALAAP